MLLVTLVLAELVNDSSTSSGMSTTIILSTMVGSVFSYLVGSSIESVITEWRLGRES